MALKKKRGKGRFSFTGNQVCCGIGKKRGKKNSGMDFIHGKSGFDFFFLKSSVIDPLIVIHGTPCFMFKTSTHCQSVQMELSDCHSVHHLSSQSHLCIYKHMQCPFPPYIFTIIIIHLIIFL